MNNIKYRTSQLFLLLILLLVTVSFGSAQVQLTTSNLPIIIVDTNGQDIPDEPKIIGTMKIINNANGINSVTDTGNEYDGNVGIELRGQTSQLFFEKKSYGLELRDEFDADSAVSLFGMGKEEDWILHGPYSDKSLLRNYLTFYLWDKTGRYGSDVQLCEVVINDDYRGVYVFMEKIKRDDDRVDISNLRPDENSGDDLTGGYIIKIDKTNAGEVPRSWFSEYSPPDRAFDQSIEFFIDDPDPEDVTDIQFNYIRNYVSEFENALAGSNFTDPVSGYRNFIDIGSFVDYSLLTEVNRNVDGYRLSTYLYKDRDSQGGKLVLGPPWDYNLAFGNADYCNGSNVEGWAWDFNLVCNQDFWLNPFWWNRLLDDAGYRLQLQSRWNELRSGPFSTSEVTRVIDSLATVLEAPQARNFQKYNILNQYIWPNNFVGGTYAAEIEYLKDWITARMEWMDDAINAFDVVASLENEIDLEVSIYPNPTQHSLKVESKRKLKSYTLNNSFGQRIKSAEFNDSFDNTISLMGLQERFMFLQLFFEDGTSATSRVIRQF